ncbi:MAG TPA: hypothetical protein VH684_26920 [Xanthobacteraceae bacterium]|jgi:hypothetical protein
MVSWFISPWEAARLSMQMQRLIALQLLSFAFPKARLEEQPREETAPGEGRASGEEQESGEEQASGDENSSLPRQARTIVYSEDMLTPSTRIEPGQRRIVAARSNTHKTKKANGIKRRSRRDKGKR